MLFSVKPGAVFSDDIIKIFRRNLAIPGYGYSGLTMVEDDIWWTKSSIGWHCDSTREGYVTQGLILVNDLERPLLWGGSDHGLTEVDNFEKLPFTHPLQLRLLRPGDVYILDGRVPHCVPNPPYLKQDEEGLFIFLAWDVPFDKLLPASLFARKALNEMFAKMGGMPHPLDIDYGIVEDPEYEENE